VRPDVASVELGQHNAPVIDLPVIKSLELVKS
jgi:hypothetical protein